MRGESDFATMLLAAMPAGTARGDSEMRGDGESALAAGPVESTPARPDLGGGESHWRLAGVGSLSKVCCKAFRATLPLPGASAATVVASSGTSACASASPVGSGVGAGCGTAAGAAAGAECSGGQALTAGGAEGSSLLSTSSTCGPSPCSRSSSLAWSGPRAESNSRASSMYATFTPHASSTVPARSATAPLNRMVARPARRPVAHSRRRKAAISAHRNSLNAMAA
mmetsp:Transcript_84397/g.247527  ORF Transcript_84397/g.247527 Transcript_84397/m.247527 type:complete len:226 (+) Transcript_84397:712-1389(+)